MGLGRLARAASASVCVAALFGVGSPAFADETRLYTYDALGRLVTAESSGTVNNNQANSICYDPAGNRVQYRADSAGVISSCATTGGSAPPPVNVTVAISDTSGFENSIMTFTVTLSAPAPSSMSVYYATATGTAGTSDFVPTSGTLTFTAGQQTLYVYVEARGDTVPEGNEQFYVDLSNPTGGLAIVDSRGVGTIFNNGGLEF